MKKYLLITSLVSAITLTGCADMMSPSQGSSYYPQQGSSYQTQSEQKGVVESVRNVMINTGQSGIGIGTIGGAVLGGLAGSAIGQGHGSVAAAVGGAAVGGVIGHQIEKNANTRPGLEITVRLEHDGYVTVTQDANEQIYVGERVLVISDGNSVRVTRR